MEIEGGAFLKGTKVHLKADPSILWVITSRELGGAENRYEVFLNNASTKIMYWRSLPTSTVCWSSPQSDGVR